MKNSSMLITSLIGGAIIGSVVTCLLKSEKGKKFTADTHNRIIEDLKRLHSQIGEICHCSQSGECSCSMGGKEVSISSQNEKE